MKRFIILMLIAIVSINMVLAQGKVVTGVVTGDAGPLEGATVVERGAVPANGTKTDKEGNFSLTLKGKSNSLLITSINFLRKEVPVDNTVLVISLERDPKSLEDVVIIAYGKQKKIAASSAVSSVSGVQIRQNPATSLQNGLVGRMPGFSAQQRSGKPGSDGANFFIRGTSSYNTGGNTPLIIIDDIEYSYEQFSVLDPNEVENITILKDASSTAVYGIKGANGVVIVTTRRGKTGPAKISLRSEYATMEPTTLPKYLDAYTSARLFDSALLHDALPLRFSQADLDLFQNGQDPYGHPNVDWGKVLFRKYSHLIRNNIDISGGTDKVKYFASLGYISQGGILNDFNEGQGFNSNYYNQRFNYRSNIDITVSKTTSIKVDIAGNKNEINTPFISNASTNGGNNDPFYEFNSFLSLAPFAYPIKNPNDSWGYSTWQLAPNGQSSYNGNNLIGRLALGGYNRNYNDNMVFSTNLNQKLDIITKGLSVKLVTAYTSNYTYDKSLTRQSFPSYIYNINTNAYTVRTNQLTNSSNIGDFLVEKLNTNYQPRQTFRQLALQAHVNYDRTFNNHHVYGLYLYNRDSKWANNTTVLAQQYNYIPINFTGQSLRLGYDFKNKYLFQFNVARNGTDRFGDGKRFGFFPAVSAGYNLAEENFFKKAVPFIDVFKLRGSYGLVGSDLLPPGNFYSYKNDYLANGNTNRIVQGNFGTGTGTTGNVATSIQEGTLENQGVTWEKEKQTDIGVDFSIFNRKVSGSFDYFNRDRYDILTNRGTVSQIFGQNLPPVNLGRVNNKGYEIELTYADKIGKDFSYSVRGTYAVAKNKRIFIDEPTFQYAYQQSTGRQIGDPLIYKWTGHFYSDAADIAKRPKVSTNLGIARPGDLEYEDVNKDGIIDENDRGFFASPNLANTNYSFSTEMNYKSWGFSILFQGTMKGSSLVTQQITQAFVGNITQIHTQAWTPDLGDNALYPRLTIANNALNDPTRNVSTYWYKSNDYLRLRTAQISYQVPARVINKLKIDNIRLYVNGNNLLTWSDFEKKYNVDPEVAAGSVQIPYPTQRTLNLGLNVTF